MRENHAIMRRADLHCLAILVGLKLFTAVLSNAESTVPVLSQQALQDGGLVNPLGQPGVIAQPIMVNSFENVEMERLRLAEEIAKMERDEADFREQVLKLQKKLADLSMAGVTPSSMPSDFRTFLSANAAEIKRTDGYYKQLKSLLNDLTPSSPYRARLPDDTSNPRKAAEQLKILSSYEEDDDICRTISGHISSLSGGRVDDSRRHTDIRKQLEKLAGERRRLEWNLRMANGFNPLSGRPRATEDERSYIRDQINDVAAEVKALEDERKSLSHLVTAEIRKLQFQQFIIELAIQQRYIHSLIACGFYRNSFRGGDLKINDDAYPSQKAGENGQSQDFGEAPAARGSGREDGGTGNSGVAGLPSGSPFSAVPSTELPVIATITGLEAFLLNRIRDAIKDRQAIDNMLGEGQISAAESVLRKMMLTAKYQPELQTVPYADRQKILGFGQNVKNLSDALNARDYAEIAKLAAAIESNGSDAGTSDLKVFAAEHPRKALHWAKQAELALRVGDRKTAQSLMEAAVRRAPLTSEVVQKINQLQDNALNNTSLAESLQALLDKQDYETAFQRMNEFLPLVASDEDRAMQSQYEQLLDMEKTLRAALEKSDALEQRGNHPEAWIALCTIDEPMASDSRVNLRKSRLAGKSARFVSNYTNAVEREQAGKFALALAWYLSALTDAPGSEELQAKVNGLGNGLLNN
jgi:hypothetical protein